jgi:hypothetical protein
MKKRNNEVKALAICMVLSVILGGTVSAAVVFADKVDYRTGRSPHGIYATDFDGDGDMDVVVTNSDSSTFSYFANRGDGTFLEKVDYKTGENPKDIYAADFDGDGDMDVVTAGLGDPLYGGTFSYFANTGDGTFSAKEEYDIGQGTTNSIHATDFDGDGDEDIVTTIFKGFSYLENYGDGTFSPGTDYKPHYGTSTSIYAADFDNDGDNDVVTTYYLSHDEGYFSCFANIGDGTFSDPVDHATGADPSGIYATDFDGDGDNDLVTVNSGANAFSYFENVLSVVLVSDYTTKPPEIDGIIRPGEWTNKMSITLNGYEDPKSRKEGELYVMNDDDNIYIAVVIPDADETKYDYLLLDLDQGNDHIATDGDEDAIRCIAIDQTIQYTDMHWDSTEEWWSEDLNAHGDGSQSYVYPHPGVDGKYRYEFVKPLKSGDTQDMALNLGDTIGFRIEALDYDENPEPHMDWYRYPQNTVDADTSRWDGWADLIIAVPDGGGNLMEGDANGDGCVSLKDSTVIKQYLVDERGLTESQLECADTNDDSEVSLKDSTLIRKWLVDPSTPLWESPADDDLAKPETC